MEDGKKKKINISERVKSGDSGIVSGINVTVNERSNTQTVIVKLRVYRVPERADKYAPRYAQKATVGIIVPDEDMPFDADGNRPDIIVNPLAIHGRQTMSYPLEILFGLIAGSLGQYINADPLRRYTAVDIEQVKSMLVEFGYSSTGKRQLRDGQTGKPYRAHILVGPCYFQVLRHNVLDKFQSRGTGSKRISDRAAVPGKSKHGGSGSKIGVQEQQAMISHGASNLIQDRMCFSSNVQHMVICGKCNILAEFTTKGEIKACRGCGLSQNNFGKIAVPYVSILLQQYLRTAGIEWRINTLPANEYDKQRGKLQSIAKKEDPGLEKGRRRS